jgi:hypothetical protein
MDLAEHNPQVRDKPEPRRARGTGRPHAGLALLVGMLLFGCRHTPGQIELPPLPKVRDAAADLELLPDGAKPCAVDLDCDDGVDCTRDVCLPGHFCVNAGDSSRCSDGVFCNGPEVCDPSAGCLPGTPERCSDDDVCTVDSCDEVQKRCAHDPRDFDGDGEADWHCAGGTDCDDLDPTRGSNAREICRDGIDNDCDNQVDETNCTLAQHDRCDDALDVSAGGAFAVDLGGAAPDYALSCDTMPALDVAFTFSLSETKDVTLTASGLLSDGSDETAAVSLRSDCGDSSTERKCSHGFPAQVRVRALLPGRYFAIVSSEMSSQVVLDVRFDPPSVPATNTTCDSALDVSAGGRFEGNFVDTGDDETLACGFAGAEDLVYRFTTTALHDVELSAISVSDGRMSFGVRSACHDAASTIRCVSDAPARARLYQLPAGTYYVVLEGPASREVDFALEVAFVDPTSPPPGDGCGAPLELPLGTKVNGTLANRQDLVNVECGCDATQMKPGCQRFLPDVVYHLRLDEPTDLAVMIDGGSALMVYGLRTRCDLAEAQLTCGIGTLLDPRVRDLQAGDYYMIFESPAPASDPATFSVKVDQLPRTVPTAVNGNDTCATAIDIPQDGGLFAGDTLTMLDDYQAVCGGGTHSADAAFRLVLSDRAHVAASIEAPFDSVLYRYKDTGDGPASCRSRDELACNDDGAQGNTNSQLSEVLDPGTYYYVVDGFSDDNQGKYLLDVTVAR